MNMGDILQNILGKSAAYVRRSAGAPTTARVAPNTIVTRQERSATHLTARDDKPSRRPKDYQPGMRSAFGLPTRAAHSRMRMDDFSVTPREARSNYDKTLAGLKWFNNEDRPWVFDPFKQKEGSETHAPQGVDAREIMKMASLLMVPARGAAALKGLPAGSRYVESSMGRAVPGSGGPVGAAGEVGSAGFRQLPYRPPVDASLPTELQSILQRLLPAGPRGLPNGPYQMPPAGGYPFQLL